MVAYASIYGLDARTQEITMPLVRIDLQKGKDAGYRQKAGRIVYEAMLATINVPKDDRF